jgi:hypothetical protein
MLHVQLESDWRTKNTPHQPRPRRFCSVLPKKTTAIARPPQPQISKNTGAKNIIGTAFSFEDRSGAATRVAHGRKGPKRLGQTRGSGEAPAGFGAAAPGPSPRRAIFFNRRGQIDAHSALRLGLGGRKKLPEVHTKKLPLRKRPTKTQRRPANLTGKWRRPNEGGALAPAFKSRTAPCAPPGQLCPLSA